MIILVAKWRARGTCFGDAKGFVPRLCVRGGAPAYVPVPAACACASQLAVCGTCVGTPLPPCMVCARPHTLTHSRDRPMWPARNVPVLWLAVMIGWLAVMVCVVDSVEYFCGGGSPDLCVCAVCGCLGRHARFGGGWLMCCALRTPAGRPPSICAVFVAHWCGLVCPGAGLVCPGSVCPGAVVALSVLDLHCKQQHESPFHARHPHAPGRHGHSRVVHCSCLANWPVPAHGMRVQRPPLPGTKAWARRCTHTAESSPARQGGAPANQCHYTDMVLGGAARPTVAAADWHGGRQAHAHMHMQHTKQHLHAHACARTHPNRQTYIHTRTYMYISWHGILIRLEQLRQVSGVYVHADPTS